jgi:hypothetical protein
VRWRDRLLPSRKKSYARKEACHDDIDHSKEIVERSVLHSGDSN